MCNCFFLNRVRQSAPIFFALLFPLLVFADGSRDLYLTGNNLGYRSYLISVPFTTTPQQFNPFPSPGRMWVYANAGETIYVGSSLQGKNYGSGSNTGTIILSAPSGHQYTSGTSTSVGLISNKSQEEKGPKRKGVNSGYTPYTVLVNETGVWEVQFVSLGTGTSLPGKFLPQEDWTQPITSTASALIAAWDVSVGNATSGALVSGRTYTTLLALCGPNSIFNEASFYGKVYVLTPSGYVYEVDNNGQNGGSFNFFSNNKGLKLADGAPSYESASYTDVNAIYNSIYDPRIADNGTADFTNKVFYSKPAADLPKNANVYFSNTSSTVNTWLKPGSVSSPTFVSSGLSASCGGQLSFTPSNSGIYRIALDVDNNGAFDDNVDVLLTGDAVGGKMNSVIWDGKDALGHQVVVGTTVKAKISISLPTSEVHFPFIDLEANSNGIKIQRLSADYSSYVSSTVYWNDAGLSGGVVPSPLINKTAGVSSVTNGHIWASSSSSQTTSFGNNKILDTWAFVSGNNQDFAPITLCRVISGHVWLDRDKLTDNKIDNEFTSNGVLKQDLPDELPASGLYATLVNASNVVLQSVPVVSGSYMFTSIIEGNYKVILNSTQSKAGSTLSSSILPTGWSNEGDGLGSRALSTDGILSIGTIVSSTNSITDANFGIYNADALPVNFGSLNAKVVNGQLLVEWSTLKETNNSYFEVESSKDGKTFVSLGKVASKARDGNSDVAISYDFTKGLDSTTGLLGISLFSIALVALLFNRKNKSLYALVLVFGLSIFGVSCKKQDVGGINTTDSLMVRIKQVDKDGSVKYSSVVKATVK